MQQRTLFLVSGLGLLLAGCAAYTERQFSPDPDCVNCQSTADGVDAAEAPDAPAGGGGDAGADAGVATPEAVMLAAVVVVVAVVVVAASINSAA